MTKREELLYRAERLRQSAELAKAACLDALELLKQTEAKND